LSPHLLIHTLSLHDALPISHALGDRHDVGRDARPFVGEQLAGPSETRVDLVVEQQQAELLAHRAQRLEEFRRRLAHAAFALDRLDRKSTRLNSSHVANSYAV